MRARIIWRCTDDSSELVSGKVSLGIVKRTSEGWAAGSEICKFREVAMAKLLESYGSVSGDTIDIVASITGNRITYGSTLKDGTMLRLASHPTGSPAPFRLAEVSWFGNRMSWNGILLACISEESGSYIVGYGDG